MRDPLGTFEANVAWSVGLLDAARLAGVRRFVFASSNAAAGDHPPPATRPTSPTPSRPMARRSSPVEAYCQAYAATYGLAACSLRFSNAYGPYSLHKKSVVAAWLRAALAGEPITINGDGEQTRDFVYADDLAAAVVAVLDAPEADVAGELFQAGTGRRDDGQRAGRRRSGARSGRPLEIRHGPARAGDIRRNVSRVDKAATRPRLPGTRAARRRAGRHGGLVRGRARRPRARRGRGPRRVGLRVKRSG